MNRIVNFFKVLTVILAIQLLTITIGAETLNGISVSSTELSHSEEFYVEVSIPSAENADTASLRVEFDENVFEVIEWNPEISGGIANSGAGFFGLSAANAERRIDLSSGMTLSAKMRVKDEAAEGEYSINLVKSSFCYVMDNGYEFKELWFPEAYEIIVKITRNTDFAANETETVQPLGNQNTYISNENNSNIGVIIGVIAVFLVVIGLIIFKRYKSN